MRFLMQPKFLMNFLNVHLYNNTKGLSPTENVKSIKGALLDVYFTTVKHLLAGLNLSLC